MGLTTAAMVGIGVGCFALGAGAGGGAVAYYHHRKKQKEIGEINKYKRQMADLNLKGKNVRAVITSTYY